MYWKNRTGNGSWRIAKVKGGESGSSSSSLIVLQFMVHGSWPEFGRAVKGERRKAKGERLFKFHLREIGMIGVYDQFLPIGVNEHVHVFERNSAE